MTDKEVLTLAVSWFLTGADKTKRIQSGNLSHDKSSVEGQLLRSAEFIQKHIDKQEQ